MDILTLLSHLVDGFVVALSLENIAYCFLGALIGTLVGVLPGISPTTAIAILLPLTFRIPAVASLIMLCGIYYGAHHAGSTTAIMLNMPGEPYAVVICLDGHPMARQGRAASALSIAAIGSTFAGAVGFLIIALFSPVLAEAALSFQSPEYAATVVLALVVASALSGESVAVTLGMAVVGLLIGSIGTDVNTGILRFSFGVPELFEGVEVAAVAIGLFAFAELVDQMGAKDVRMEVSSKIRKFLPTWPEFKASVWPILRGTGLGSAIGIFPGTGPFLATFASYALEKKVAKDPSRFGKGAIEGVAGPEAASNAAAITHFIPMLTLGIPAGASMALMLSAMLMQGIAPGADVMTKHPDLFWGVIASMAVGNVMLLILNLPMIGIWVRLLMIPYRLLYPAILAFCCIGAYASTDSPFGVYVAALAGFIGYIFSKLDCSPAPLILGLVLGPMMEQNVRRSMQLSRGDPMVFLNRPISLALLLLALALAIVLTRQAFRPRAQIEAAAH